MFANGNRMDTERVWERARNGNRTDTEQLWEWEQNGNGTGIKRVRERARNGNGTDTEQVREREQNRNGTDTEWVQERKQSGWRMGTERVQNGYQTVMEQIWHGCESQKWKKAFSRTQTIRECSLEHLLVSLIHYHSPYQGFGNDVTLNTRSSNFCPAWRSWENDRANHLMSFLFLFIRTKQASSLHLLVHFMFIAAILLSLTSPSYIQIRKWMDESGWTSRVRLRLKGFRIKRNKTKHWYLGWPLLWCCLPFLRKDQRR